MRILLISLFLLFTATNVIGQSTATNELKILTWNIYMLPAFPIMTGQVRRAKGIVEVLGKSNFDVICFQEAYHGKAKKIIDEGLKIEFPYRVNTFKKRFSIKATSGLWILSKYPIEKIAEIEFEAKQGLDGQARKGAILFEMNSPKKIQFINTHLQSGVRENRDPVRKDQCTQILTELIEKHANENLPLVLMGDWNMKANSSFTNDTMYEMYNTTHTSEKQVSKTWPAESFGKGRSATVYDLIMIKDINSSILSFEAQIPDLKYKWKKGKDDLADHLPVAAIIGWK